MEFELSRAAAHFIKTADKPTKKRIKDGIDGLLSVPPIGDIKPLQGYSPPVYRLRIGKFRIIYEYKSVGDDTRLYIRDIGARGDIYK